MTWWFGATIPRLGELPSQATGTSMECLPMAVLESVARCRICHVPAWSYIILHSIVLMFLYAAVYFFVIQRFLHGLCNSLGQLADSEYVYSAGCDCAENWEWDCDTKYPG